MTQVAVAEAVAKRVHNRGHLLTHGEFAGVDTKNHSDRLIMKIGWMKFRHERNASTR